MTNLNLTYGFDADALPDGAVTDSRLTHTSSVVSAEAIAPGLAVAWDGLISHADAAIRGVARWSSSMVQTDAGVVTYSSGDVIPVVSFGPVRVPVIGAVTAGARAYAFVSGGNKGKFTATAGGTTTTAPVGIFETATGGDGSAILFMQYVVQNTEA